MKGNHVEGGTNNLQIGGTGRSEGLGLEDRASGVMKRLPLKGNGDTENYPTWKMSASDFIKPRRRCPRWLYKLRISSAETNLGPSIVVFFSSRLTVSPHHGLHCHSRRDSGIVACAVDSRFQCNA